MGQRASRVAARAFVSVSVAGCLLSSCITGDRPELADERPPPSTSPTPAPTTPPPPAEVTLAFAGDVHFVERTETLLNDPAGAFGPIAATLSGADLAMVNLETAITTRGTPEPKQFHFRAAPSAFDALRGAGVDVVSMANNHAVDYGPVGLEDSFAAIEASRFPVVGIGRDAAHAYAPWYVTVKGVRVAIIGASQVNDRTLSAWTADTSSPGIASAYSSRLLASVQDARRRADIVVVYLHWGQEGNGCPLDVQKQLAGQLSQAGADAVVGTHAHLLLGGGWLGRTFVTYGLGNFVWWRDQAFSNDTGVLTLTVKGKRIVSSVFTAAVIDPKGVPIPARGTEATRITGEIDRLRDCAGLADGPSQ